MVIEQKWCLGKPSLFTQYRIRIANELRLAQQHEHCNSLHREIALVEEDITQILKQITPIDFAQINEKLNSCITSCQTEQKRTLKEYTRVKKQLIHLAPKLLIGNAYFRARYNEIPIQTQPVNIKKRRKRLKLTIEQQWKKGIGDAYHKLQIQRDKEIIPKHNEFVNISIPIEPLPITNDYPIDDPPILTENIIDEIKEHEFVPPLPPPPLNEIIIPFQTPPSITCRSPPSDRLHLAIDDTIVKPHRLVNKTLGNITQMSFHIDPDQCSSPKPEDRKKKTKLKNLMLPPVPPQAPLFSSTAIFDTHAFFTQTTNKAKKQKKKIDIALLIVSFFLKHIDPDQCSSPKPEDRKKKTKLKNLMLPPVPPQAPLFSSTAIFDTHAFFTQTTNKAKKQKKKIDIARQPVIMTTNDIPKKKIRTKKSSPYDFQDDDNMTLSRSKGTKLLTDDIITARFAKNSHYQSHQTSVASTKSSKSHHKSNEREHKKKKKNILGIGTSSSPLISSTNLTLSPGRLSTDHKDNDDDYEMKSSLSRRCNRTKTTTKCRRTRVK
ncbi:unnamed protein product [Adineta steineri]|uniref:Uncharacterized protein n=1 Tax=Adineta steineri TaxID=433720 RepID=A0A815CGB3_9BILA|nr:unnamed protein product [Adineta steineri]